MKIKHKRLEPTEENLDRMGQAANPQTGPKGCLTKLSAERVLEIWNMRCRGLGLGKISEIMSAGWVEMGGRKASTIRQSLFVFFRRAGWGDGQAPKISPRDRSAVIKHELAMIQNRRNAEEAADLESFNPLGQLTHLAYMQRERIQEFRRREQDTKKPIREIDGMVTSLRLILEKWIDIAKELQVLDKDGPGTVRRVEAQLKELHIHLQKGVDAPDSVSDAVSDFLGDLEKHAIDVAPQATDDSN